MYAEIQFLLTPCRDGFPRYLPDHRRAIKRVVRQELPYLVPLVGSWGVPSRKAYNRLTNGDYHRFAKRVKRTLVAMGYDPREYVGLYLIRPVFAEPVWR